MAPGSSLTRSEHRTINLTHRQTHRSWPATVSKETHQQTRRRRLGRHQPPPCLRMERKPKPPGSRRPHHRSPTSQRRKRAACRRPGRPRREPPPTPPPPRRRWSPPWGSRRPWATWESSARRKGSRERGGGRETATAGGREGGVVDRYKESVTIGRNGNERLTFCRRCAISGAFFFLRRFFGPQSEQAWRSVNINLLLTKLDVCRSWETLNLAVSRDDKNALAGSLEVEKGKKEKTRIRRDSSYLPASSCCWRAAP